MSVEYLRLQPGAPPQQSSGGLPLHFFFLGLGQGHWKGSFVHSQVFIFLGLGFFFFLGGQLKLIRSQQPSSHIDEYIALFPAGWATPPSSLFRTRLIASIIPPRFRGLCGWEVTIGALTFSSAFTMAQDLDDLL